MSEEEDKNMTKFENNTYITKVNKKMLEPKSSIIQTASKYMFDSNQKNGFMKESPLRPKSSFIKIEENSPFIKPYNNKVKEEGKLMNQALREKKIQESMV